MKLGKRNQSTCRLAWHDIGIQSIPTFFIFQNKNHRKSVRIQHLGGNLFNMKMKYVNSFEWEVVFCFHMTYITLISKCNGVSVNKYRRFMVIGVILLHMWCVLRIGNFVSLIRFRGRKSQVSFLIKYGK